MLLFAVSTIIECKPYPRVLQEVEGGDSASLLYFAEMPPALLAMQSLLKFTKTPNHQSKWFCENFIFLSLKKMKEKELFYTLSCPCKKPAVMKNHMNDIKCQT